jgi:hypothetical protein
LSPTPWPKSAAGRQINFSKLKKQKGVFSNFKIDFRFNSRDIFLLENGTERGERVPDLLVRGGHHKFRITGSNDSASSRLAKDGARLAAMMAMA